VTGRAFLESLGSMLEARAGVEKLREAVLDLAVRGMLSPKMGANIDDDAGKSKSVPFRSHAAWEWKALVELGITQTGSTPATKISAYWGADVPFVTPGDIDEPMVRAPAKHLSTAGASQARIVQANSVLMVCIGGSLGKVGYVDSPVTCNQQINAFTPSPQSGLDPRFACLALRSPCFKREAWTRAGQGTLPIISKSKWEQIPIPVPPLPEQKRIVAKVDQLMALCDDLEAKQTKKRDLATQSTRSALTALASAEGAQSLVSAWDRVRENFALLVSHPSDIKPLKETLLSLALQGNLTTRSAADGTADALHQLITTGAERTQRSRIDSVVSEEAEPFPIPSTWRWIRIGDLGRFVGGGTPSKSNTEFWAGKIPWVSPKDMKRPYIEDAEDHISREALEASPAKLIPAGALLFVVRGMILAHSFPVALTVREVTINQDMKGLCLTVPEMGEYVLRACQAARARVLQRVERSTHGTCRLDSEELENLAIPLPPVSEQKRIVARLNQLMSLLDDLEAKLRKQEETATRLAESLAAAVAA
jgi:type I restriction enzyme, S subunit